MARQLLLGGAEIFKINPYTYNSNFLCTRSRSFASQKNWCDVMKTADNFKINMDSQLFATFALLEFLINSGSRDTNSFMKQHVPLLALLLGSCSIFPLLIHTAVHLRMEILVFFCMGRTNEDRKWIVSKFGGAHGQGKADNTF